MENQTNSNMRTAQKQGREALLLEGKIGKTVKDTLKRSYSIPVINDETIKGILSHSKFFRAHVRTTVGKIYKTGEFEQRSDRVLGMKLP